MNKKTILIVALVLTAVLALVVVLGSNKEAAIENKPTESQVATEEVITAMEVHTDIAETTAEEAEKSTDATEAAAVSTEKPKGSVGNTSKPTDKSSGKTTETKPKSEKNPTKETELQTKETEAPEEETEPPAMDENGITDAFVDKNVNLGVVKGEDRGEDIDDSDSNAQTQPPKPTENNQPTQPVVLTVPLREITFEMYNAMSAAEQQAVIDSFGSMGDFVVWFNYLKEQYEAEHPDIEIGADGVVDLS